jgi:hypothetical protein
MYPISSKNGFKGFLRISLALTCAFVCCISIRTASAELSFTLPELEVNAGDTGQILVSLEATDGDLGALITGYTFQFDVASGVSLTGAPDQSVPDVGSIYNMGNYTDGTLLQQVNGANFLDSDSVATIASGGLARVDFEIPAGTAVDTVFPLAWTDNIFFNVVSVGSGETNPTLVNGSITVIPEPNSIVLGLLAGSLLLSWRRRS